MQDPLLHYEVHGTHGPFILLVHGLLSSRAQWLPNLGALSQFSRPVVTELFGHGRSPSPEDPECYTPDNYVLEFERIRNKIGVERWFLCGQSLGAALTLRYALRHPDHIIAQVFTNSRSAFSEPASPEAMSVLADRLEKEGYKVIDAFPLHPSQSRHIKNEIKDALVEDVKLIHLRGFSNTILYTAPKTSLSQAINKNQVPALLVAGRFDKQFTPLIEIAEKNMPKLEVLILDGGHAINIQEPDKFNEAVRNFILRFDER
ncbi:MAG: alpha/beta hydrolase [Deltaproteobacteria bacterium]|nr:alpha/beta hydrolase [Deltaproteobacteria bacterium]MBW2324802.1 alpha/beta hydrolase [Deltaproteobacteria bacterium]